MSWRDLVEILTDDLGPNVAARVESRICHELGGRRLTVGKRTRITAEDVEAAAPGNPAKAAKVLGIHRSTAYRALQRKTRQIR